MLRLRQSHLDMSVLLHYSVPCKHWLVCKMLSLFGAKLYIAVLFLDVPFGVAHLTCQVIGLFLGGLKKPFGPLTFDLWGGRRPVPRATPFPPR